MTKILSILLFAGALFAQNPATAVYPAAVATDTDLGVLCNSAHTKLAASMTALDTAIAVANGAVLCAPGWLTVDAGSSAVEVIKVCSKAGNNLTVCTGGRGSGAKPHAYGVAVDGFIDATYHNQTAAEVKAIQTALGVNLAHVYPGAGVANSTGTAWGTSYTVGTAASNLVQLNSSGQLPAVSAALLTNLPIGPTGPTGATGPTGPTGAIGPTGETAGTVVTTATYRAAVCAGGSGSISLNIPTAGYPSASCIEGANTIYGVAQFATSETQIVEDHFALPADWTGNVDLGVYWNSAASDGAKMMAWQLQTACVANGASGDPAWNAAQTIVSHATSVAYQWVLEAQTAVTTTGCASGNEFFFRIFRAYPPDGSDTLGVMAQLISLRWTVRHN